MINGPSTFQIQLPSLTPLPFFIVGFGFSWLMCAADQYISSSLMCFSFFSFDTDRDFALSVLDWRMWVVPLSFRLLRKGK